MTWEGQDLKGIIKIRQILAKTKQKVVYKQNNNYEEFRQVYKGVFTDYDDSRTSLYTAPSTVKPNNTGRKLNKNSNKIKTIRIELPPLGAERAILKPKKPAIPPKKANKKASSHIIQTKDEEILTQDLLEHWSGMEERAERKKSQVHNSPSMLLEKTNKDIDEAAAQLEQIKSMIAEKKQFANEEKYPGKEKKQLERNRRRSKSPSFNPKKKQDRHYDCASNKYCSTLFIMKQKLQKLESKYFNKPQVVYKSVRDIHTQPSNVEILFENDPKFPETPKIDEALLGIKQELDSIANAGLNDEEKSYVPRNLSFKKPINVDCRANLKNEPISNIIDFTESRMKKYRNMKQDLVDVEAFCEELCNIGKGDIENEEIRSVRRSPSIPRENPDVIGDSELGIFENTELQKSVSKSDYLMNEFNIRPKVKVFSESRSFIRRSKFIDPSESKPESSITSLIENLNLALQNSIYKPVEN